jgi:hypothetical protein
MFPCGPKMALTSSPNAPVKVLKRMMNVAANANVDLMSCPPFELLMLTFSIVKGIEEDTGLSKKAE